MTQLVFDWYLEPEDDGAKRKAKRRMPQSVYRQHLENCRAADLAEGIAPWHATQVPPMEDWEIEIGMEDEREREREDRLTRLMEQEDLND